LYEELEQLPRNLSQAAALPGMIRPAEDTIGAKLTQYSHTTFVPQLMIWFVKVDKFGV